MKSSKFGENKKENDSNSNKYKYIFVFILGIIITSGSFHIFGLVDYDQFEKNTEKTLLNEEEIESLTDSTVTIISASEQGTGFFYKEKGYIITNEHVIVSEDNTKVRIEGLEIEAEVIGQSEETDIAVLKVDSEYADGRGLELADSLPEPTTPIVTITSSRNMPNTITEGKVNNNNRLLSVNNYVVPDTIQMDAKVNKGSSGGPIFSKYTGEVVGIVRSQEEEGVNFGINSIIIEKVFNDIVHGDGYQHSILNIRTGSITEEDLEKFNIEEPNGVLVDDASEAEGVNGVFNIGSLITEIDGVKINSQNELASYLLLETEPGDTINVTVLNESGEKETYGIIIQKP